MEQQSLWEPKRRIEVAFRKAMLQVAREIIRKAEGIDDAGRLQNVLLNLTQSSKFQRFAESAARKMVTGLFNSQAHTWRQAATKGMMSRTLYLALQRELRGERGARLRELIHDATYRIVTLPSNLGHDVANYTAMEALKGRRASDIAKDIIKTFPERTEANAKLIARTQVSMTSTNLTRLRAENIGANWYVWKPVGGYQGDGRTRSSHARMAGVIVNWKDPPAPEDLFPRFRMDGTKYRNTLGHYHAGQCPNCRCYPEPIIDLDLLEWPSKIYIHGTIVWISKKQFERIMNL